ncbi:MAG: hypothetical protein JJU00_19065 [Opitutales bacterium]|nr:hypothetical protein [Opitutales bacterium]
MTAELDKPLLRPKFSAVRRVRRDPAVHALEGKEDIDSFVRTCASRIILKLRQSALPDGNAPQACDRFQTGAR